MVDCLKGLEPKRVLEIFSDIAEVPHGSRNEKALSDKIRMFCEGLGLETYQDEANNLIIKKPATPGYEQAPVCVLQAHLDMVCEKKSDVQHDFLTDPIRIMRDGDRIYADGTTLGADDATGVAFALAVLESKDLPHPALEVVLTANEEAGMTGIQALDFNRISGRVIINLDCSDEGIVVGCAGTATVRVRRSMKASAPDACSRAWRLHVSGLKGGHSGLEIKKERGNANAIAARIMDALSGVTDLRISSIEGGFQNNAITRECEAVFAAPEADADKVREAFETMTARIKKELKISDAGFTAALEEIGLPECCWELSDSQTALSLLLCLPSGVMIMNQEVPGLPELSGNIGVVRTEGGELSITLLYRSCYDSRKQQAIGICRRIAQLCGAQVEILNEAPEWEYKADSRLSALIQRIYKERYGEPIVIEVSHGGNECGTFFRHFPDADIVCTGTKIIGPHTPEESVMLSIIQKEWGMLCKTLEGMLTY